MCFCTVFPKELRAQAPKGKAGCKTQRLDLQILQNRKWLWVKNRYPKLCFKLLRCHRRMRNFSLPEFRDFPSLGWHHVGPPFRNEMRPRNESSLHIWRVDHRSFALGIAYLGMGQNETTRRPQVLAIVSIYQGLTHSAPKARSRYSAQKCEKDGLRLMPSASCYTYSR